MARSRGPLIAKILIGGVLGLLALAAAVAFWAEHIYEKPGPLAEDGVILVAPGTGVIRTAYLLESMGAIEDARLFHWATRLTESSTRLQAGEFRIPAHASIRDILDILKHGQVVVHRLTLPEGATAVQAVAFIDQAERLSGALAAVPAEGTLLPETYHYTWGETRDGMVARMQKGMRDLLAELWPGRAPDLPFSTPEDAVILASIIEKETAVPEERRLIAGVFINRLKKNMRLQSDPTVIYGITGGKELGRALVRSDLDQTTPYNTYRVNGLPPTPIANPGRASIEAALNPAATDALYFVADGKGGHAFADSYEEHLKNVKRWRDMQRQ